MKARVRGLVPGLGYALGLVLGLAVAPTARATSPSAVPQFERGNAAYEAGDFESAIETFSTILASGIDDAAVHYNLGNAYFKTGRLGFAIYHYRRAHELAPRDDDIRSNLEYARFLALDSLEDGARTDLKVERWIDRVTPDEAARLPIACWLLAALSGLMWQLGPRGARAARRSLVVFLILWAVSLSGAGYLLHRAHRLDEAVVLDREAKVRIGPGDTFDLAFVLHEGAEVVVEGERGRWTEISLPGELRGWVESDGIARL